MRTNSEIGHFMKTAIFYEDCDHAFCKDCGQAFCEDSDHDHKDSNIGHFCKYCDHGGLQSWSQSYKDSET